MTTSANIANVKMGACSVVWGGNDMGYTQGGVQVAIKTNTKALSVDQFGEAAVDEVIMGRTIQVTVPMAEHDLNKLLLAIPGSSLVTDSTTPTKMNLTVNNSAGLSLRSLAQPLVLHPSAVTSSDKSQDLIIPIAAPSGNIDFEYAYDKERIFKVTFTGYPDNTTGELYTMGDPSASGTVIAITSGTYNATTGAVVLTFAAPPGCSVGEWVNVTGLTGTGSFAELDGNVKVTAISGDTLTYIGEIGLAATTITGGNVGF